MENHKTKPNFLSDTSYPSKEVILTVRKMSKKNRVVELRLELADPDASGKSYYGTTETDDEYKIALKAFMTANEPNAIGVAFWRVDFNTALFFLRKKWGPRATRAFDTDYDPEISLADRGITLKEYKNAKDLKDLW